MSEKDFKIEGSVLVEYIGKAKEVIIPTGITRIGRIAFRSQQSIMRVVIPEGVVSIGKNAFAYCQQLTSVEFPQSLLEIEGGAFENTALISAVLPPKLTTVGSFLFYSCNNLESVELPMGVTTISVEAFGKCGKLKKITIPNSVTLIEPAFGHSGLESIELPEGITEIRSYTFYECRNLKTVKLPDSVVSIGEKAFGHCVSLEEVVFPKELKYIGINAFERCSYSLISRIPNVSAGLTGEGLKLYISYDSDHSGKPKEIDLHGLEEYTKVTSDLTFVHYLRRVDDEIGVEFRLNGKHDGMDERIHLFPGDEYSHCYKTVTITGPTEWDEDYSCDYKLRLVKE